MSKVSFIKSDDRRYNIERCLSLIKSEIISGLKNASSVVVKPSCLTDNIRGAATSKDALAAVLSFIKPYVKGQITLAEGVSKGDTLTAFTNFDYLSLQEKYDFSIVDLNLDEYDKIPLIDNRGKIWAGQIAKTITRSDYLISISSPKTHSSTMYGGVIENIAIGSLIRSNSTFSKPMNRLRSSFGFPKNNKALVYQGERATNENIKRVLEEAPIRLAVLDAFEAMEGDGPINGNMVPAHFAVASSDAVAADSLACKLMNIDPKNVGYLTFPDASHTENFVVGDDWKKNIMKFKLPSNFNNTQE